MKVKMTVNELAAKNLSLREVTEREHKYVDICGSMKFPAKVSIAIAKNQQVMSDQLKLIVEQQAKNEIIAEKQGIKLEELAEQKELMDMEVEIDIHMITESDIEKSQVTSADVLALMFMTEGIKEGGKESC